jgi:hypothetical protein
MGRAEAEVHGLGLLVSGGRCDLRSELEAEALAAVLHKERLGLTDGEIRTLMRARDR